MLCDNIVLVGYIRKNRYFNVMFVVLGGCAGWYFTAHVQLENNPVSTRLEGELLLFGQERQ